MNLLLKIIYIYFLILINKIFKIKKNNYTYKDLIALDISYIFIVFEHSLYYTFYLYEL